MYNAVSASNSGAWASSCLCAYFRALGPAWADVQAESPLSRAYPGGRGGQFPTAPWTAREKEKQLLLVLAAYRFTGRQAYSGKRQGA